MQERLRMATSRRQERSVNLLHMGRGWREAQSGGE